MEQFPEDPRQVVRSQNADGTFNFGQVDVSELSTSGRFGLTGISFSSVAMTIGLKDLRLIEDVDIRVGDDVQVVALDDPRVSFWGEVLERDTSDGVVLTVVTDDLSSVGEEATYSYWQIQIVARPKPGIEKDTSTSSVDPTGAGPFTFTVTADKFFPLGGTLLIKPTTDRTIALLGKVKAYSSTSLVVEKTDTNATVSTSYTSWSIALLDAPTTALSLSESHGLKIINEGDGSITISRGRIRDYSDTIDLVVDTPITKFFNAAFSAGSGQGGQVKVAGAGTITTSGTTVTGSGTNFLTVFAKNSDMLPYGYGFYDYDTTALVLAGDDSFPATISAGSEVSQFALLGVSNTSGVTTTALGLASATAYYRGGYNTLNASDSVYYGVVLTSKDADGSVDVCFSSPTSGVPDLPSGYSKWRVIGVLEVVPGGSGGLNDIYERNSIPALSVVGNNLNVVNDRDINYISAIAGSGAVLRENSNLLDFGTIATAGITNDAVTNAKLANMAAYTLKGRNAGTTGDPSDIDISALTEKTALVDNDLFLIQDSEASNAFKKAKKSNVGSPNSSFSLFIATSL